MQNNLKFDLVQESDWDQIVLNVPDAHFMQTSLWAKIKKENGWFPHYMLWKDKNGQIVSYAMVLEKEVQFFHILTLKIHYAPKGPIFLKNDTRMITQVLSDLNCFSKLRKGIFIKIDPDLVFEKMQLKADIESLFNYDPAYVKLLKDQKWVESNEQVQFRNTIIIPLKKDANEILMEMKQKTRYNIRLSEKKGVKVRIGGPSDFDELFSLYAETAMRDGFVIRAKEYYLNVWTEFFSAGICEPLIAEYEGKILAAVIIYYFSNKAFYVYGMSSLEHRNLMATYLLQWKAILRAKEKNCKFYDLWGAPDELSEEDRMWGVYKFKTGFGGIFIKTVGAWDYPINKLGYQLYNFVLPKVLFFMRKIGFQRLQKESN